MIQSPEEKANIELFLEGFRELLTTAITREQLADELDILLWEQSQRLLTDEGFKGHVRATDGIYQLRIIRNLLMLKDYENKPLAKYLERARKA